MLGDAASCGGRHEAWRPVRRMQRFLRGEGGSLGGAVGDGEEGTGSRRPRTLHHDWVRSMKQRQQSRMMLEFSV